MTFKSQFGISMLQAFSTNGSCVLVSNAKKYDSSFKIITNMTHIADTPPTTLELCILHASYTTQKPAQLPGDNLIRLRGAFGRALMSRACHDYPSCNASSSQTSPCQYPESCVYHTLSQPNQPSYLLNVPTWTVDQEVTATQPLRFFLTLFGPSVQHRQLVVRALQDMSVYLFHKPTPKPQLANLYSLGLSGEHVQLYPQTKGDIIVTDGLKLLTSSPNGYSKHSKVNLRITTPMHLERYKQRIFEPNFTDIMYYTLQRIKQVAGLPHSHTFPLELRQAEDVNTALCELTQHRFFRKRTGKPTIRLEGFMGDLHFEAVPHVFIPYLQLASILNLGRKTTHGLGQFQLNIEPSIEPSIEPLSS
jgi:hypothetical protein